MSGQRALIYSRVRKNALNPGDSDITRAERNQDVEQALMGKLYLLYRRGDGLLSTGIGRDR